MIPDIITQWDGFGFETVESQVTPAQFAGHFSPDQNPVILESTSQNCGLGRYSIVSAEPAYIITIHKGVMRNHDGEILAKTPDSCWETLDKLIKQTTCDVKKVKSPVFRDFAGNCPLPAFFPGWVGYLGYELGQTIEKLPANAPRDTALPDARLAFYDTIAVYDHELKRWQIFSLDYQNNAGKVDTSKKVQLLKSFLNQSPHAPAEKIDYQKIAADLAKSPCPDVSEFSNFRTPGEYKKAVQKCIDYIHAGDIFQVNLTQRFRFENAPDPVKAYKLLSALNPAWYSAFLQFPTGKGQACILSCSPELFLECKKSHIKTKPIKGTRKRYPLAPQKDAAQANQLLSSEKDNAELAMIIDLLRNDIGKVCTAGSVKVTTECDLETHPTVYHLVGTVEGDLAEDKSQTDLLKACFPGGSITGAPKIRAMEIIDELEPNARSVYTGAIGIISASGDSLFNIAIRTIYFDNQTAYASAGGGIVSDSEPELEYQETLAKAAAMVKVLTCKEIL